MEEGENRVKLNRLHPESGQFALRFKNSLARKPIVFLGNSRFHRFLYCASWAFYFFSKITWGDAQKKFFQIAKMTALHSGIARLGGKSVIK